MTKPKRSRWQRSRPARSASPASSEHRQPKARATSLGQFWLLALPNAAHLSLTGSDENRIAMRLRWADSGGGERPPRV